MSIHSIAIIEDDAPTLSHLVNIISSLSDFSLSFVADNLADARLQLTRTTPQVLLADLGLPDGDGTELIREVFEQHPQTLIMVLSSFGDEQKVISAIMAGAKGYILKGDDSQDIDHALRQLVAGGSPISASIARYLLMQLVGRQRTVTVPSILTERETQVLEQIAMGYRYAEIAERLFISYHTVNNHIRNIYDKLAVSSRSQAIHKASELGLLQ